MKKIRISLALILLTLIVFPMQGLCGTDKDQMLLLEKTFPTESGERLKVNAYAGDVIINPWCKNAVKIKIYGSSEALKYLDFNVSSDELGINIEALQKAGIETVKNLNLRYEICVPRDYGVKVNSSGKNVTIDNPNGPVEISKLDKNVSK